MHFTVCIPMKKGDPDTEKKINGLLARYDINRDVEPYRNSISSEEVEDVAKYYNLPVYDLKALAEKMEEWSGYAGAVDKDGLYQMRTDNPEGYTDYWAVYDTKTAEELLEKDFVEQAILHPNGEWISSGTYFYSVGDYNMKEWNTWRDQFRDLLGRYKSSDGYVIALVDCHS